MEWNTFVYFFARELTVFSRIFNRVSRVYYGQHSVLQALVKGVKRRPLVGFLLESL